MGRKWRKEPHRDTFRVATGRVDARVSINLGRVSVFEAERALVAVQKIEDEGAITRLMALVVTDLDAARAVLLGDPAVTRMLPAAPVNYGAMTLSEYFDEIYSVARQDQSPGNTIGVTPRTWADERWVWRQPVKRGGILDGELGTFCLSELDDQAWERWQQAQTHVSARTKAIRRNAYAALLGYARRMGHFRYRPEFFRLKGATKRTREQVDPLTVDEVLALLEAADPVRRAMWAIGAGQGLRPSELVRVEWPDIDWKQRTMLVRGSKTDASWDRVPMTPLSYRELQEYWVRLGQPDIGRAFLYTPHRVNGSALPRPFASYKKALDADAKAAGIARKVTPYLLRHSFATIAYLLGIEKDVTRRIGRWTDDEMLDNVYTRPRPADLVAKLAKFDVR
jgi:integrase